MARRGRYDQGTATIMNSSLSLVFLSIVVFFGIARLLCTMIDALFTDTVDAIAARRFR